MQLCEASSSAPELTYATISAEFTLLMFDGNDIEANATCQSPFNCNGWASLFQNFQINSKFFMNTHFYSSTGRTLTWTKSGL